MWIILTKESFTQAPKLLLLRADYGYGGRPLSLVRSMNNVQVSVICMVDGGRPLSLVCSMSGPLSLLWDSNSTKFVLCTH